MVFGAKRWQKEIKNYTQVVQIICANFRLLLALFSMHLVFFYMIFLIDEYNLDVGTYKTVFFYFFLDILNQF